MHCKICGHTSNFLFKKQVLQKYNVAFFQCSHCGFLQTEEPYWLLEAYQLPFNPLDVYLASRPLELSQLTENLILNYFDHTKKFLDYGGGIGLFTRMMRDRGLQFYRQDKYAQNLFAQFFDISDLGEHEQKFELVTCFEVLEHLEQPIEQLAEIFRLSDHVFCSTVLQPYTSITELNSWDYLGEIHGQHIAFYTKQAMKIIAEKFNRRYYSNGIHLHLFTKKDVNDFSFYKQESYELQLPYKIKNKLIILIEAIYKKVYSKQLKNSELVPLIAQDAEFVAKKLNNQNINTQIDL